MDSVEGLTGVGVDHYAEANLLGFYRLTQAVGGVQVCLNEPVDDPCSGADFSAGVQTVSGSQALAFVRQRHGLPMGDLDRVQRQQAFLAGLARSMLSSGTLANPGRLGEIFDSVQDSLVLDDGWDVLSFTQQMQGLAGGDLTFDTIPVENPAYETPEGEAVKVDPDEVAETIQRVNDGRPPEPRPPRQLAQATVDVRNTTDITGLAGRVSEDLAADDVPVGDTGNADPRETSQVRYAPGEKQAAGFVADRLDGIPTREDPTLTRGEVRVLLADDYDGPALQTNVAAQGPVQLDGSAHQAPAAPAAPPEPSDDAITADDIPCVN
ncbi:LCP family protein [Salinifilum ghardaiensis]